MYTRTSEWISPTFHTAAYLQWIRLRCNRETGLGIYDISSVYIVVTLEVDVSRFVDRQVLAGETVVLECNLEAVDDVIAVRWERMDGVDLPERRIITRDYSLIIPDVTVLDIACYQCIVETGSGNAELLYGVIVFGEAV